MPSVKEMVVALSGGFNQREDLQTLVGFTLDDRSLDQIANTNNLINDVRALVVVAKQEGWLYKLLQEAAEMRPNNAVLARMRDETAPLSADPANPWRAFVINGQPLVDRDTVRDAVKDLDDDKRRILVVFGEPTVGKTHIANLITWRASESGDLMVSLDLARLWDVMSAKKARLTPREVAESLCDQLKLDYSIIPPNEDEQDSRWAIVFCDRVQAHLSGERRCWVVVDEFNKVPVSQQTADLFKEFAIRVSQTLTNVRLVMLGYADPLPSNVEPGVLREKLRYLEEADLKQFFADVYRSSGKANDAPGIAASVARMRDRLHPADSVAIRELGVELAREFRGVTRKNT